MTSTAEGYDPLSPESKQDPEALFRILRDECPVHHYVLPSDKANRINENPLVAQPTSEFWSVLRYEDCLRVLRDGNTFSSKDGPGPEYMLPLTKDGVLLFADNPAHIRQRRIAQKAFTPRSVELLEPHIQDLADRLIDGIMERGSMDLMAEFAIPLTARMIARILGIDDSRFADFQRWGNAIVAAFGGGEAAADAGFAAMGELFAFVQEVIDLVRAGGHLPREIEEGVLASLVRAEYEGDHLTDEEIRLATMQLLVAGFETTSTATGAGIYLLCTHPAERQKLIDEPALIKNAVEEILRFMAPLEGLFRTTTEDVEISGCPVPKGSKVRVVFSSANRDEAMFSNSAEFRIDRDEFELRNHVGFGSGIHTCIGAALARAELRIGIGTLLSRLPGLALDGSGPPPERNPSLVINGFVSMPVRWDLESVGTEPMTAGPVGVAEEQGIS